MLGKKTLWHHHAHEERRKARADFVRFRTERNAQLGMPRLILPSLQVNMRGGDVPSDAEGNLVLKVPLNRL